MTAERLLGNLFQSKTRGKTSAEIKVIKEKLLGFDHTRKRIPTILSIHGTTSWEVPNLELPGFVCYGSKFGFATLLVSEQFCTVKRSWKSEERCTAILFGTTVVIVVYAPDSKKSLEMYQKCISSVVKVLREGRTGGARGLPYHRRLQCRIVADVCR